MKERIAIIAGYRSAMGKAGGGFKNLSASDLGARIAKEGILRAKIDPNQIDEAIIGNVAQPADSANIARVIALKAGIPESSSAFTVHRNCASGMEAFTTGALKINSGYANLMLVGGVESMSNIPLFYGKKMTEIFAQLAKAKTLLQKIEVLKEVIDTFEKDNPLKRYRGDIYYEMNNLSKLFSVMKKEGWSSLYIIDKIEQYVKEIGEYNESV